ncbi:MULTISPECIES: DUF4286 family protein [unclassified Mesorhizobium]|uniref:DUF4286 family protein n=1 Tax=unclassified Mesorhizobium TaxID=325217 RepID=UPI000FDA279D|nr:MULTISPECIES: DUF4286 family protein [unclassified Mesorhizobium]TGR23020.1 hypothetical protein EN840_21330 [Mesorhizobium sp. M8A.F.Ca.ET.197.01.1.1]TGR39106.1 hypothetical protein EN842_41370 [bacterium M00.F.Ca.ET.199.01.1.1]TGR46699.1 hypothetical protein EN841_21320 [Mesorhizobium sp. M8A.F.Ca.ET.198.01.1.1]TGV85227.1 hypothetical protein EN792_019150 [Mesorhizobium sp. M00.F.Ca.ET.149.01.1.1]
MENRGLLMVIADPHPAIEEEFNAWFDTEHYAERMTIRGFRTGKRFVSCDRAGRYLALYDLDDVAVLHSDEYRAFGAAKMSAWTRRILPRQPSIRHEASQIHPGDALQVTCPRHLLLRFDGMDEGALRQLTDWIVAESTAAPGVVQRRLFRITDAEDGTYLAIISGAGELAQTLELAGLGEAFRCMTLMETFAPYR